VRASFADLTLCDVKLRVPSERAAARVLDVEAEVDGRSGTVGEGGTVPVVMEETL
jgi:hypothetical protein